MKQFIEIRRESGRFKSHPKPSPANISSLTSGEIESESRNNGWFGVGKNGSGALESHPLGHWQVPTEELMPSRQTILRIVNKILGTNCQDADAIDATATWKIIVEEIQPYDEILPILALRFQNEMNLKQAAKILEMSLPNVTDKFQRAMEKLRHPCRILRIRNSIMGWPNLYRDANIERNYPRQHRI